MRNRADDIRKRIASRKKDKDRTPNSSHNRVLLTEDEERYGFDKMISYEGSLGEGEHPLFRKEVFLFKILASACLVLIVAIMFRNQASAFDPARDFVKKAMDRDFQFAAVSDWYEKQFGKPLALLPLSDKKAEEQKKPSAQAYALPATAKILEDFDANGQRIMIETGKDASVKAMSGGLVRFAGEKEGFGKTVIIQHADKSESWYGNLDEIKVTIYQYLEKGSEVGTVSDGADAKKGAFYFAIKKGDNFIDPIQVIQFE